MWAIGLNASKNSFCTWFNQLWKDISCLVIYLKAFSRSRDTPNFQKSQIQFQAKLKRVGDAVKSHGAADAMDTDHLEDEVDYEDLKQFLLIGGPKDPFALQYNEAAVQDTSVICHLFMLKKGVITKAYLNI